MNEGKLMKFNAKIYQNLTGEPAIIQDLGEKKVEVFYMNDTPYFAQFANRGKLAVWASDGKNYRLLIEKGYYESVPQVYSAETNKIWTKYFDTLGGTQKKLNLLFILISLILIGVAITLTIVFDQQYIGIIGLVVVLVISVFQNWFLRKKVSSLSDQLQYEIRDSMGEKEFENAVDLQRQYYDIFYAPKNPDENEVNDNDDVLEIEQNDSEEGENNE